MKADERKRKATLYVVKNDNQADFPAIKPVDSSRFKKEKKEPEINKFTSRRLSPDMPPQSQGYIRYPDYDCL